jgi:hypothetical protein
VLLQTTARHTFPLDSSPRGGTSTLVPFIARAARRLLKADEDGFVEVFLALVVRVHAWAWAWAW